MPKKIYIRTFGCQMNVRDSEIIAGLLVNAGYKLIDSADKADTVLFNTCSVRQHAEDKVWSEIGRFKKKSKGQSPGVRYAPRPIGRPGAPLSAGTVPIIGLVGCMAQNYKDKIFKRAPQVDFVVGPRDIHQIPAIIQKLTTNDQRLTINNLFDVKIWETEGSIRPEEIYHTGFYEDKTHAYVVISEGCSNYCSYCVVPYVRGEIRNRNHKYIIKEIEGAIGKDITKITLLGQNVNSYKSQIPNPKSQTNPKSKTPNFETEIDFVTLLKLVNEIKGLKEFSFITSHPKNTTADLFKAMADLGKLKKYLHLPVQSGSDRILELMNRGYTRKFYLDLVDSYRKIVTGGVLTTDIIVGFPSETEEEFQDTLSLVKGAQFDAAYIFKYSPRPNTAAANMADDVLKQEKERRHALILELQKKISKSKRC